MEAPEFVSRDLAAIRAEAQAIVEEKLGKPLLAGQPESLLVDSWAYLIYLVRSQLQDVAANNLAMFAKTGGMLDYLAGNIGLTRLPAESAKVTLRIIFTAQEEPISLGTMPAGSLFSDVSGEFVFAADEEIDLDQIIFEGSVSFTATAQNAGALANGIAIGKINTFITDPPGGTPLYELTNTNVTSGGADGETDEQLRSRITSALDGYSTAGSAGSYAFFARSANPKIIDVSVVSPNAGTVKVVPLGRDIAENPTQEDIVADVAAFLNAEDVRPLCDTVIVEAPQVIEFGIGVTVFFNPTANQENAIAQIEANLQKFISDAKSKLGFDIYKSRIIGACMVDGVKNVWVNNPIEDIDVSFNQVAVGDTGITIGNGGVEPW